MHSEGFYKFVPCVQEHSGNANPAGLTRFPQSTQRRVFRGLSWIGTILCLLCVSILLTSTAQAQNPIVIENQQPGTTSWQIPWGSTGNDTSGQIKGYADNVSVNKGQSITFYVSVNPVQTFSIDVYRMGWYQGTGGRLMQHIGPLNGVHQATCPTDATTGMIECHWTPVYTLATQASWTSGIYLALLTNSQGLKNYIIFVVRDDSRVAALLYQQPVTTYQAYNNYPYDNLTGKSLYAFNSYGANTISGGKNAVKVSFDRPYLGDGTGADFGTSFFSWENAFVRWMEKSGYDVTYATDLETHTNGASLLNHGGILSVGHDEYWSKPMYDAFAAAVNGGVNLAFFGSNAIYWQVRFETSSSGVPNRVLVCYRDATLDPNTDPTLKTINWRDPLLNRPEQTLIGVQYSNQTKWSAQTNGYFPYVVANSANWVYAGTGFRDGDSVPGMVGYEADRSFSQYPPPNAASGSYTLLSNSPYTSNNNVADQSNSSVYQASSGAWVFAAGTDGWSYALDNINGNNALDSRIQQATANILNRFVNPLVNFTVAALPSTQSVLQGNGTSYNVTITPSGGFNGQVTLSVSGLPSGAGGTFTPNPATASSTLAVTTSTSTPTGTYTLTITASSGTLTHTTTVALTVNTPPSFTLSASPSSQTVTQGNSANYNLTITPAGGFNGQVSLGVAGLPTGAAGTFTPNPATTSSALSVTTSASTPTGTYTLTITGASGSLNPTTTVTLVVSVPDFTLGASPSSQTVAQGGSTNYTVTVTPILGFAGQVNLSVAGLPSGANGSFNPNPAISSSTLSVTTSTSTPTGTYTLTITGISGPLTHTATVSLTVNPPGVLFDNKVTSGFQWGVTSVTTPAFVIGSNTRRAAMIMVSMTANNATNITASLGGVNGTLIPGTDTGTTAAGRTLIFQVINPPSGSQTAKVSWTTSMNVDVAVITVSGANQTTPCINGTFSAANSSPAATTSLTITSNPGDLTASVGYTQDAWISPFTNQTLKWGVDSGAVGGDIGPGTGTTTHTWTDQFAFQTHMVSGANFSSAP